MPREIPMGYKEGQYFLFAAADNRITNPFAMALIKMVLSMKAKLLNFLPEKFNNLKS